MLIDRYSPNWLDQLDAMTDAPESVHLFIDGVCKPGLHRSMQRTLQNPAELRLLFECLPGCNDEVRDVSPFVVPYTPANRKLRTLLKQCDGMPMVHAMHSAEPTLDLAARLSTWCVVEVEGQRFNLRFPDTRRLPGIHAALRPLQQRSMFGPTARWSYVARNGQWAELERPISGASPAPEQATLDVAQFSAMVDDGEADSVMLLLRDRGLGSTLPHSALHATVAAALELAAASALQDSLRLDWCEACVRDTSLLTPARQAEALRQWQQHATA